MRYLFLVLLLVLLTAGRAAGSVVIMFDQRGPAACPIAEPPVVKNDDGTYSRPTSHMSTLASCWSHETWLEVWTDRPEHGGKFVRRLGRDQIGRDGDRCVYVFGARRYEVPCLP